MRNNACKTKNLSSSFHYYMPTKFNISSNMSPSPYLHAAVCDKRGGRFRQFKEGGESRDRKTVFGEGFVLLN